MYNPLLGDVTKIKDADLEAKILDLSKKYSISARMGHGGVCEQIISALAMYKDEMYRRQVESTQKIIKKQDNDFDDLINVN
jgi:fructose-1,6-bisphosphatase/sedoheptulose 1,7-bisphosphatase-like protein